MQVCRNLHYEFIQLGELRSIAEFKAALQMDYFGTELYSTFRIHPGNSDGYFKEDSLGSGSCVVLHVRDSVPN